MSNPREQARGPGQGQQKQPGTRPDAGTRREEQDALEAAVGALEGAAAQEREEERSHAPEALAKLAQSARQGERRARKPAADAQTAPRPASNADKHEVASKLLEEGAEGGTPDPHEEGVDKLPDRIIDRG